MKKQKKPASLSLRGGSYSLILTAVVLALVMVLNVLAGALPENMTKYDMSATKLYSVTGNTRAVISALEDDVTIYWIVQAGEEDDVIENLLGRYESLSEHIQVVKKNPDVYPAFAEQYTDERSRTTAWWWKQGREAGSSDTRTSISRSRIFTPIRITPPLTERGPLLLPSIMW